MLWIISIVLSHICLKLCAFRTLSHTDVGLFLWHYETTVPVTEQQDQYVFFKHWHEQFHMWKQAHQTRHVQHALSSWSTLWLQRSISFPSHRHSFHYVTIETVKNVLCLPKRQRKTFSGLDGSICRSKCWLRCLIYCKFNSGHQICDIIAAALSLLFQRIMCHLYARKEHLTLVIL